MARSIPPALSAEGPRSENPELRERARALRIEMVRTQLRASGIHDSRVLRALGALPRHCFAPSAPVEAAYSDASVRLANGRELPSALLTALMVQGLELSGTERVLDIGTGSGYQAALLGLLAKEVYSVDSDLDHGNEARTLLAELRINNVELVQGPGLRGMRELAPFQAILVNAAVWDVPPALIEQLADGGRLVAPVGDAKNQLVVRLRKRGVSLESQTLANCSLSPLDEEPPSHPSWPWIRAVRPPSD